jgi:hypothetical protein
VRQQRDQVFSDFSDLIAKPAFELFGGGTKRQISPRADQIDDSLGLGQIHLAIQKRALGELARPRRPCSCAQARFKNFRGNQRATVAADLDQILARVTGGRAVD